MAAKSQILTRTHLLVFFIFVAVSLVGWAVWVHRWQATVAHRDEMNALYTLASGGDLDTVKRLADYPSPEAMQYVEKLAQDRSAFAEVRVEAINLLAARHSIDSKTLAPLLSIDQPFVVRQATAEVFEQRGCADQCISVALNALHEIWRGQLTLEMQLSADLPKYGLRPTPPG